MQLKHINKYSYKIACIKIYPEKPLPAEHLDMLIDVWIKCKESKDYEQADNLRKRLTDNGFDVEHYYKFYLQLKNLK